MQAKDIRLENIVDILDIWRSIGGNMPSYFSADRAYRDIRNAVSGKSIDAGLIDGYRIGSRYCSGSKLKFMIESDGSIRVKFNSNMPSYCYPARAIKKAWKAEDRFLKLISAYLKMADRCPK